MVDAAVSALAGRLGGSAAGPGTRRLSRLLAASVCLLGLTGLLGWWLDLAALRTVLPGAASMKFNTATGLLLASLAVLALGGRPAALQRLARALGGLVMLLGIVTVSQDAFGWNLGVDAWLFDFHRIAGETSGRMAPATALCFVLCGNAIAAGPGWMAESRAQWGATVAGLLALLAVFGYALDSEAFSRFGPYGSMALHTAAGFVLLAIALWLARPRPDMLSELPRALTAAALVALGFIGWQAGERMLALAEADRWTTHTQAVIQKLDLLFSAVLDAQSAQRGYIITGDENRLLAYQAAVREVTAAGQAVRQLTADNPDQQQRLAALEAVTRKLLARLALHLQLRREQGFVAAQAAVRETSDLGHLQRIRQLVAAAAAEEQGVLAQHSADKTANVQRSVRALAVGGGLAMLALFGNFVVLTRQMAHRRQSEAARLAAEKAALTGELADAMPQIVWTADAAGAIDYCNRHWLDYSGRTLDQTRLAGWLATLHPDDLDSCEERWRTALAGGEDCTLEARLQRAGDGGYRWHLGRWVATRDAAGGIVRWIGTWTDIDDQKRSEAEVRALNAGLERRVAERTAAVEEINRELEAFTYSVSHDLRAPLRHLSGFAELLEQRFGAQLEDKARHYVVQIAESAGRMGQLIDDLLAFSRVGRSAMSKTNVELRTLLDCVLKGMADDLAGRRIDWRLPPPVEVLADPNLLRLVLVNLLSNAVKFTGRRDEARIEVGWQREPGRVVVFVRDNGAGFDMEFSAQLFGVFQRLHKTSEFEGTGIGLANVRRIVRRHGGEAWAEGRVGEGATFSFSLPTSEEAR